MNWLKAVVLVPFFISSLAQANVEIKSIKDLADKSQVRAEISYYGPQSQEFAISYEEDEPRRLLRVS